MPRTISYSTNNTSKGFGPGTAKGGGKKPDDDYGERLLKYVPAETLSFFAPATGFISPRHYVGMTVVVVLVGVLGNIIYNMLRKSETVMLHYYVLSTVAFIVWAWTVDPKFAELCNLDDATVHLILLIAVFLLPGIDSVLAKLGT
jgi:hypothetical protein